MLGSKHLKKVTEAGAYADLLVDPLQENIPVAGPLGEMANKLKLKVVNK